MLRKVTKMPLANHPGSISDRFQQFSDRDLILRQSAARMVAKDSKLVVTHAISDGIPSGQQSRAAWSTNLRGRIELGKPHSFCCHAVKIRSANCGVSVATEIAVSQIIRVDQDDVRLLCRLNEW